MTARVTISAGKCDGFRNFYFDDFSTTEYDRFGTGGLAFGLVEAVDDECDDVMLDRSDASLLSASMSSLDSYFRAAIVNRAKTFFLRH